MIITKKSYHNKFIIITLTLIIIVSSGHVFQTIFPQMQYLSVLSSLILIIPVLNSISKKKVDICLASFLIFCMMFLVTCVSNFDPNRMYYILNICILITAYGMSYIYSFDGMVNYYIKIMSFVTIIGLIGYFLINNTVILNVLPRITSTNNFEYYVGGIFNSIVMYPTRNCGMFWEPGLFATYLTIALVFEIIYREEKTSVFRVVIFCVGILTAHSSAGYVLLILVVMLMVTKNSKAEKKGIMYIVNLVFFILMLVCLMNYESIILHTPLADSEYIQKLMPENFMDSTRVLALNHNLKIFFQNPIFGVGITSFYSQSRYVSDTSTSTFFLSVYGIIGIIYTVLWIYAICSDKKLNIYSKMIVIAIIFSILNKEPHSGILFTWCLLFWLLQRHVEYKKGKNNECYQKSKRQPIKYLK